MSTIVLRLAAIAAMESKTLCFHVRFQSVNCRQTPNVLLRGVVVESEQERVEGGNCHSEISAQVLQQVRAKLCERAKRPPREEFVDMVGESNWLLKSLLTGEFFPKIDREKKTIVCQIN